MYNSNSFLDINYDNARVIGFDLGHGEFSIAKFLMQGDNPEISEINGKKSQITAIVYKDGHIYIGEQAINTIRSHYEPIERNQPRNHNNENISLEMGFKQRPSKLSEKEIEVFADFIRTVYKIFREGKGKREDRQDYLFIGCPSGWEDTEKEAYQKNLNALFSNQENVVSVIVVREARAAFMQAKNGGNFKLEELQSPILVVDIGSSTTDVTLLDNNNEEALLTDDGVDLGGSLIDKALFKYFFEKDPNKNFFEKAFATMPSLKIYCEYLCRLSKEEYFNNPDQFEKMSTNRGYLTLETEKKGEPVRFFPEINGPIMREILAQPLEELDNKTWKEVYREMLTKVRDSLKSDKLIKRVFVTGGASRMQFVQEISEKIFPNAEYSKGDEPELAIAFGLARWGRMYLKQISLQEDITNVLSHSLQESIEKHIDQITKILVDAIADSLFINQVDSYIQAWNNDKISDSNLLIDKIKKGCQQWFDEQDHNLSYGDIVTIALNDVINNTVIKDLNITSICSKHGIKEITVKTIKLQFQNDIRTLSDRSLSSIKKLTQRLEAFEFWDYSGAVKGGIIGAIVAGGITTVGVIALGGTIIATGPLGLTAIGAGGWSIVTGGGAGTLFGHFIGGPKKDTRTVKNKISDDQLNSYKKEFINDIQTSIANDQKFKQRLRSSITDSIEKGIEETVNKALMLNV
ncbi:Hsp70 family protein [Dolichospermum sp. LEGE 00246]|uniref:Hsp70 family protein n=1 Tax=Dolichospermum sp. LEGE 00246 TaxID=1828605 RepID=UPI00187F1D8D|nr:Hsp70 family protein [Dolichospermum sp. LEGE 00246]MBE9258513.1 Hsp70 family protein [Dolichospermum sp. LEGE 00246]